MQTRRMLSLAATTVRLVLAGLFITAGVLKLMDIPAFAVVISDFGILPHWMEAPVAWALPVLEVGAGLGLVLRVPGSLAVVAVLLVVFIAILAYALHLGLNIDCGCYGPSDPESRAYSSLWTSLLRDVGMLGAVLFLWLVSPRMTQNKGD